MIEDKYQLLEIVNRKVQLIIPDDIIFFDIRGQQARAVFLDDVDHLAKVFSVAVDQVAGRNLPQLLDIIYSQIVKNADRPFFDLDVSQRQLLKFGGRRDGVIQPFILPGKQQRRIDRGCDRHIAGNLMRFEAVEYIFGDLP